MNNSVLDFNTSNVTIQQKWDYQQHRWWENFNTSNVTIQQKSDINFCRNYFISIHLMLLFNNLRKKVTLSVIDFNTSNVTIQQMRLFFFKVQSLNFNTSNVTIQLTSLIICLIDITISIHLMLLFNQLCRCYLFSSTHFNTSNVTIQQLRQYRW